MILACGWALVATGCGGGLLATLEQLDLCLGERTDGRFNLSP